LHGCEPGTVEMTVENWINRMHPADRDEVRATIDRAIEERTEYSYELKVPTEKGERWLLEAGHAMYDEERNPARLAGISLDVTERVNWQREQSELLKRR